MRKRLEAGLEVFRYALRGFYRSLTGYIAENFECGKSTEPDCDGVVQVTWGEDGDGYSTMMVACPICGKTYKMVDDFNERELRPLKQR